MSRKLTTQLTIRTVLPVNGINGLHPGQIYERAAFTPNQIAVANVIWALRQGVVQDAGPHKGVEVILVGPRRKAAGGTA